MPPDDHANLAPLRTRLLVFALLALLALASIWLIDRRAMTRMHEYRQQSTPTPDRSESASAGPDLLPAPPRHATSRVASY
ncbi:MAG: hypothetical protein ACODAQ_12575 [Phycisphaeraceae bacterium]